MVADTYAAVATCSAHQCERAAVLKLQLSEEALVVPSVAGEVVQVELEFVEVVQALVAAVFAEVLAMLF